MPLNAEDVYGLVHRFLVAAGLKKTAKALEKETNKVNCPNPLPLPSPALHAPCDLQKAEELKSLGGDHDLTEAYNTYLKTLALQ